MKKIFTLIAVAAMAISVQAQEQYKIVKEWVPTQGSKTVVSDATASTSITYSDDPGWKASNPGNDGYGQSLGYEAGVSGTQNPKDGGYGSDGKSAGSGYSPASKNLPNAGVYYIVKASKAGTFTLGVKIGSGKKFYVSLADGTALANTAITGTSADGAVTLSEEYVLQQGGSDFEGECAVSFAAEADKEYYFFCTGSKLTFFGYTFTAGDPTGINTVKAVEAENGAAYNLAGQKVADGFKGVVIKNGRKMIQK